jgi:alpha-tubulin suppressor-like RCC1 family protein
MTTRRERSGQRQGSVGRIEGALVVAVMLVTVAGCDLQPTAQPSETEEVTAALPAGCTAATLKPVSATATSLENANYPAKNAIDGSATTRWSSAFSDPQSITVDYGATVVFSEVKITWQNSYAKNYTVQVSNAATGPWTVLYSKTGFGGGTDDTANLNGTGRYLQIYASLRSSQYGDSIYEIVALGSTNVAACGGCTPNAKQCANATSYQVCGANGVWGAATACNNQACVSGACTGVCAPAAVQCVAEQVETCSTAGQWSAAAACPTSGNVCDINACVDVASTATVPAPVAYYPLDGNALDASGNGYHGSATSTSTVAGKLGNGLSFNGNAVASASSVHLGHFELTHPSPLYPAITMCMWFNAASLATSGPGQPLFSIETGNGFAEHLAIQSAHPNAGTCGGANQIILTDAQSHTCQVSGLVPVAGWNHLCYSYDYDALKATFTLNGVQAALTNATTTLELTSDGYVGVSKFTDASVFNGAFKGTIDEVGLWSSVLPLTAIKALYDSGKGAKALTGGGIGTGSATATQVSAGGEYSCATLSDGTVTCWGDNSVGQLGLGTTSTTPSKVAAVVPNLTGVKKVAAGGEGAVCALLTGGTVKCWGANSSGQIGLGTQGGPVLTPTAVPGVTGASDLVAGSSHFCVLVSADASVKCWGSNAEGQLGIGTATVSSAGPGWVVDVDGGTHAKLLGVTSLASGGQNNQMCAVLTGGTTVCWGDDEYYELGIDSSGAAPESCLGGQECSVKPRVQQGLAGAVKNIGLGLEQTCVVYAANGTVACCGTNPSGQTGQDISSQNSNLPTLVAGISGVSVVVGGANHTCAIKTDGTAACWGDDGYGELGNIDSFRSSGFSTSPVAVNAWSEDDVTLLGGVTSLSAGLDDTCLVAGGVAQCFGRGQFGGLGLGFIPTGPQVIPSPVQ